MKRRLRDRIRSVSKEQRFQSENIVLRQNEFPSLKFLRCENSFIHENRFHL